MTVLVDTFISDSSLKPTRACFAHYLPLRDYPPVQNLIQFLSLQSDLQSVVICSDDAAMQVESESCCKNLILYRVPYRANGGWRQKLQFVRIVREIGAKYKFDTSIGYGDELSAITCLLLNARSYALHLHELPPQLGFKNKYISKSQYLELILLRAFASRFQWVSQVTPHRARIFTAQFGVKCENLYNFPMSSFCQRKVSPMRESGIVRILYIGTCGERTVERGRLIELASLRNVELHILPTNSEGLDGLRELERVQILQKVPYFDLPDVISSYDVGLVLYNGSSLNMKLGVPNKVAEYLRCGLKVMYPAQLEALGSFSMEFNLGGWVIPFPDTTFELEVLLSGILAMDLDSSVAELIEKLTFESEYERLLSFVRNGQ